MLYSYTNFTQLHFIPNSFNSFTIFLYCNLINFQLSVIIPFIQLQVLFSHYQSFLIHFHPSLFIPLFIQVQFLFYFIKQFHIPNSYFPFIFLLHVLYLFFITQFVPLFIHLHFLLSHYHLLLLHSPSHFYP